MDKVRAFLKILWVQRFWVLSVVGTLLVAICWMLAAGKLQAEFTADKGAILAKFGEMDSIKNKPFHGNEGVNAKERKEAGKIAVNVKDLWQKLYEKQREDVLYWPEALGKQFLEHIEKKKFDQNISPLMRDRYLNYIETQFDVLVEKVKAQKSATDGSSFGGMEGRFELAGPAAMALPGQPGYQEDYLVQWLDQDALRMKLNFGRRPTARQIWVRQEDLWVYEILLKVIAETNKERGATRPDNTAIRVIESLQVGAEAAAASRQQPQILMKVAGGVELGAGVEPMEAEFEGGGGNFEMESGMSSDPGAADAALLQRRYVDDEGKPLDATGGLGIEFRRLPVRMRLQMDQRWIPKVLVECANASLPIEVQRLRINPEQSGAGFDSGMSGGGLEGGRYMGGGGMELGGYAATPGAVSPDFVTVEIQGLVYIYNAPDPTTLTVPGGDEVLAATDSAVVK